MHGNYRGKEKENFLKGMKGRGRKENKIIDLVIFSNLKVINKGKKKGKCLKWK